MEYVLYQLAASSYSCGTYGAGTYESSCTTETPGTGTDTGGGLVDTGYNIIIPAALGVAIVFASIVLLIKQLRRKRTAHR